MFTALQRYLLSNRLEVDNRTALRDFSAEGHCSKFCIDFKTIEDANTLMFEILTIQHEKTVHTILRMEGNTLYVSIEHPVSSDQKAIAEMILEIDRRAKKIKYG